jgi:hypothetical protein
MAEENKKSLSLPNLKEWINEAQEQHLIDLDRLYTLHAEEYFDDAYDQYLALDDEAMHSSEDSNDAAGGVSSNLKVSDFLPMKFNYTSLVPGSLQ